MCIGEIMDSLGLNENVCLVCLKHNGILNWNDKIFQSYDMSYKDCYFKYTYLEENDLYGFYTRLCEMCASQLRNAHMLFERALDSFCILQVSLTTNGFKAELSDMGICNLQLKTNSEDDNFDEKESTKYNECNSCTNDKKPNETQNETYLSNMFELKSLTEAKYTTSNSEEMSVMEYVTIEPVHFTDIKNFETSAEHLQEDSCDTKIKISKTIKSSKKRKKDESPLSETPLELEQKLEESPKQYVSKKAAVNTIECKPLANTSEENLNESCEVKSLKLSSHLNTKFKKKRPLMCAYCSLWVNGSTQLKLHEATHSENRKRTETCPQCGIKLYTKVSLNNHMKIHDENRQKRYKCEFCEKAFFNRGALNVHRRIHLGLMVKCPICSKEFYRQVDLNKHLPKHSATPLQNNVQQRTHTVQCQYCNKYVRTDKWRGHKAKHLNQPEVKCKICDKNFFARSKCVSHLHRFHKKNQKYEEFIHHYGNSNTRLSHLIIKQQEIVKSIEKQNTNPDCIM